MTDPTAAPANTTPTRHRAALALVVGLVLTCSGGPDGDSSATATTATAATTTATTTTSVAPASSAPAAAPTSSTPGSTSSAAGGSTTSTTVLVLTTLEPLGAEEAAVAEAAAAARTAEQDALADPDAEGLQERLDAVYADGGQSRQILEDNLQFVRDEGYRIRQNTEHPREFIVEDVTLLSSPPSTRAEVIACVIDTGITYEPGGAPDGSDAIVNDDVGSVRVQYTLVVEDGTWQLLEGFGLTEFLFGELECRPR